MIFLIYDNIVGGKVIPNGYNMSTTEFQHHLHSLPLKSNHSFSRSMISRFSEDQVIPITTPTFLSNQDFFLNNGKVFYVTALSKNIIEYRDLFYLGMNFWINSLDEKLVQQIKLGQVTLVLECLFEDVDLQSLDSVISKLEISGIKNFQIWTCYGPPDKRWLRKYHKVSDYIIDLPYHEQITLDFYQQQNIVATRTKKYMYLCRRITTERISCFAYLAYHNLLNDGFVSIPGIDSLSGRTVLEWLQHQDTALDKSTKEYLETYFKQNPQGLTLDSEIVNDLGRLPGSENYMGFKTPPSLEQYYSQSYMSLISEGSLLPDQYMITEKTYRAMLYKHMFFIVGPRHILKALHKKGYKTFNHLWSEDYDIEIGDSQRIIKALDEFKKVLELDLDDLYQQAMPIIEHNYNLAIERAKQKIKL